MFDQAGVSMDFSTGEEVLSRLESAGPTR